MLKHLGTTMCHLGCEQNIRDMRLRPCLSLLQRIQAQLENLVETEQTVQVV
jgi:hypothetical protein